MGEGWPVCGERRSSRPFVGGFSRFKSFCEKQMTMLYTWEEAPGGIVQERCA